MAAFGLPGGVELWIIACLFFPVVLVVVLVLVVTQSRKSRPGAAVPPQATAPAGWLNDPTGRHQLRFWNGSNWTSSVADGGAQSEDPL
jgi:hypothetical protein